MIVGHTSLSESLSCEVCLDDSMMQEEEKTHDHLRHHKDYTSYITCIFYGGANCIYDKADIYKCRDFRFNLLLVSSLLFLSKDVNNTMKEFYYFTVWPVFTTIFTTEYSATIHVFKAYKTKSDPT